MELPDAARSPLVRDVRAARELRARAFFPLSAAEVAQLRANGNSAEDWARVGKTFADAPLDAARVRGCSFGGRVALGRFLGFRHAVDGLALPSGVYGAQLSDVVVLDDALVRGADSLLRGVVLGVRASVVHCGSVLGGFGGSGEGAGAGGAFGNGRALRVGVESGGRDLRVVADLSFDLAARLATERDNAELQRAYNTAVDDYVAAIAGGDQGLTIIASGAQLLRCARVEASYIGEHARIDDCDVQNCTILSSLSEPTTVTCKSIVRNSILQFGASVRDLSIVENALLTDCAHVKRHGVVMNAIIGSNTCVAEGEVTSSLVGPFVGFHHQALLIASVWPEGKGNVGYGANVGSNHTLKAPDQELFPGEGVFFGLGCNIKFPTNLKDAPYSVIATAVSTLPQRIAMPFALINTPGHVIPGLSPAINEISPGWVLGSSIFTVLRNERKFRTRNKAKRATISTEILNRQDIVGLMKQARAALIAANDAKKTLQIPGSGERVFTDRHISGLGKNYLRESARKAGIAAYTSFIQLFALENLLRLVESGSVSVDNHVWALYNRPEYELQILVEEYPAVKSVAACLRELVEKKAAIVERAAVGKSRDDNRGQRIIPDYTLVHKPVEDEAVVRDARMAAEAVKQRVGAFLPRV